MNEAELRRLMAHYSPFPAASLDMAITIQDRYVGLEFKDSFSNDVCTSWPHLDRLYVFTQMFVTLRSGNEILTLIGPTLPFAS